MITFYKVEKLLKIWLETVKKPDEEYKKTTGFKTKDGWTQEYKLSPPDHLRTRSAEENDRKALIAIINDENDVTIAYDIYLEDEDNFFIRISDNNPISNTPFKAEKFSYEELDKLMWIFQNPDEAIEEYNKAYPKFDMNEEHQICITRMSINDRGNITIDFYGDNRILSKNHQLYVGFETIDDVGRERNHIFQVKEKRITIETAFYNYKGNIIPDPYRSTYYKAEFLGYFKPEEEDIMGATVRWVVSDELIKTAHKEARLT